MNPYQNNYFNYYPYPPPQPQQNGWPQPEYDYRNWPGASSMQQQWYNQFPPPEVYDPYNPQVFQAAAYEYNLQEPYNVNAQMYGQMPGQSKGLMEYFQDDQGQVDIDKMMSTMGQMVQTVNQISPIFKGIGSFVKGIK
ncbi:YppG family protein [Thalassobacillus sp. CUG 92003]|uniref:YppG family protein n=1 Tax=Thalassobacillus sp. CUG 92003 TaxID=2736641 RepID=UPI0015E79A54|nr:YppG family protein [Thalassobacillus sp. CUG 92003]